MFGAAAWIGTACTNTPEPQRSEPSKAPETESKQPQRVVLITVDTMRADSLECAGKDSRITPQICAFAQRGRVYANAISPAPATLPALTSIFTKSQVANEEPATVVAHYEPLPTIADTLQSRGLQTAAFTDHHGLGYTPASPVYPPTLIQQGFSTFVNFGRDRRGIGATQLTDSASQWLAAHSKDPYFLWVHYFDPHFNYRPDPASEARFGISKERCGRITNGMDITEIRSMESTLSGDELACIKAFHEAEIYATDAAIGELLKAIPTEPAPLIIFAADHGEEFLERGRVGHEWTVYNELIHVPFVAVGPGISPGIETRVVSTTEIHSLATGEAVALTGAAYSRTSHYYGKSPDLSKIRQRANEHALVTDREKVILHPDGKVERFDLVADPEERHTIPTVEPLLGQLKARMDALTVVSQSPSKSAAAQDQAARERLQQLGYVE
jgi:arylsulfatase A-like enzyme